MGYTVASLDVPQQDDLNKIRLVVTALFEGVGTDDLTTVTGISPRHVQYTLHAARILGWITHIGERWIPTKAGYELLQIAAGSEKERKWCRRCFNHNHTLHVLVPNLLRDDDMDLMAIAGRLQRLSGLSDSTAHRRALTLMSWRDYVKTGYDEQMMLFS